MNEIVNDVVVVTIEIFGKGPNYRGDSAQILIFVLLFLLGLQLLPWKLNYACVFKLW